MMRAATRELSVTRRTLLCGALMLAVAANTATLSPNSDLPPPDFDAVLPDRVGEWRRIPLGAAVLPDETAFSRGEAVAYRAYRDAAGRVVTLVVAYGSAGGDSVRLHRPESCYVAQGYEIDDRSVARVVRGDVAVPTVRLTARSPSRKEAVSYWIRNGADFVTEAAQAQFLAFHKGQERDSALVRLSSTGDDPELFRIHEAFFAVFTEGLSQPARRLLLGAEETSV